MTSTDPTEDNAITLKEITVPLAVREWDSEREILDHFRDDARPMVRLADEDYVEEYRARYMTVETPRSVIAIYAQVGAKTAEIQQMRVPHLWLVGVDTWVFGVNWEAGTTTLSIDVFFGFWTFYGLPDGRVLILHEEGVIAVDATGRQLWYFEGKDALLDWSIGADVLHLRFLEGVEVDVDLNRGVPISEPGPWAEWGQL